MTPQTALAGLSAFFALLAAAFWVTSSRVTVYYVRPKPGEARGGSVLYPDKHGQLYEVPATLDAQSRWNRRAALAAAVAAVFQALSVAPFFGTAPL